MVHQEEADYIENTQRNASSQESKGGSGARSENDTTPVDDILEEFNLVTHPTHEWLTKISNKHFNAPVISLHLNLTPEKITGDRKEYMTYVNSLLTESIKKYEPHATEEEITTIKQDAKVIEQYFETAFDSSDVASVTVYKSQDKLAHIVPLGIKDFYEDNCSIATEPNTIPLEIAINQYPALLVVELDTNQTTIYSYKYGSLTELKNINDSTVRDQQVDKSRPNKVQRHRLDHLHRHFEDIYSALQALMVSHNKFNASVLVGGQHVIEKFANYLPNNIHQAVIAQIPMDPHKHQDEHLAALHDAIKSHQQEVEEEWLAGLKSLHAGGYIATGMDGVLPALNRHMIRQLFLPITAQSEGYTCPQHDYISQDSEGCPLCESNLNFSQNVYIEIVNHARRYGLGLSIVTQLPDRLSEFNGIAAQIYEVNEETSEPTNAEQNAQ